MNQDEINNSKKTENVAEENKLLESMKMKNKFKTREKKPFEHKIENKKLQGQNGGRNQKV